MDTITRKSLIYHTKISEDPFAYAATPVAGCSHGCRFPCYAYLMMKKFGKITSYEEWCQPKLVANALQLAQKELPKLRGKASYIHLSFATDPFMYKQPEVFTLTLQLIKLINSYDIPVHLLTKGVILPEALEFSKQNVFEITLVSLSEAFRTRYEPGTAPYPERIASLRLAHEKGFKTMVNMEPYPTPNIFKQELLPILEAVSFVDNLRLSQLNYNKAVQQYSGWQKFYQEQGLLSKNWCKTRGIRYEGLAETDVPGLKPTIHRAESLF
jgi:DNA repair photolyase